MPVGSTGPWVECGRHRQSRKCYATLGVRRFACYLSLVASVCAASDALADAPAPRRFVYRRGPGTEGCPSAEDVRSRVLAHLDHIDEHKAWAYVLHDVCGYDLKEVAKITDSSVSAAQTRLVRGRRELRARIESDAELVLLLSKTEGEGNG